MKYLFSLLLSFQVLGQIGLDLGSSVFIATHAWYPLAMWDFEESGTPSGWITNSVNTSFDYSADPLSGTESMSFSSDGASTLWAYSPNNGNVNEAWIALEARVSGAPSGPASLIKILTTGYSTRGTISVNTSRQVAASVNGGSVSSYTATTIPTSGKVWLKMRYKLGGGANAQCEVWITTNPTSGWGSSVSANNGTGTDQVAITGLSLTSAVAAGFTVYVDNWVWSANDIPASYFVE